MNLANCDHLATVPLTGKWLRAVPHEYVATVLATAHTLKVPSRFRSPAQVPYEILYLAETRLTAMREARALFGGDDGRSDPVDDTEAWLTTIPVEILLHAIVDLTSVATQAQLGTTAQELTGDWRGYGRRGPNARVKHPRGLAPTQELGAALFAVDGVEGFRTLSAVAPTTSILGIFTGKLRADSFVKVTNPATGDEFVLPSV